MMPRQILDRIDFDNALVYAIGLATPFRGITVREGMLLEGPAGWGEFSPFVEYDDHTSAPWLATAVEQCAVGWPAPVRDRIEVNCIVPAVGPDRAKEIVTRSGCATAKVKVADRPDSLAEDVARVAAVRAALGESGKVRIDANGAWDVDTAMKALRLLDEAAGGLEYAEQPCRTIEELAAVRRGAGVRVAADESIRHADDPMRVAVAKAADVAIIKCAPLGGVRRAMRVAAAAELPCAVSSAIETSVGLAAQLALAAALPQLDFACGLDTLSLLRGDVVAEGRSLRASGGYLQVVREPPRPDPARFAEFALTDPDRITWWRDRLTRVRTVLEGTPALLPS